MKDSTTPQDSAAMPPASLGSVARPNWFAFMAWAKSVALYDNAGKKLPANLATKHEIAWSAWKSSRRQAVTDCAKAMPPASAGSVAGRRAADCDWFCISPDGVSLFPFDNENEAMRYGDQTGMRVACVASARPVRPGYILGDHWLEVAYERICAGDREETVMDDYGWVRLTDAERKAIRFAAGEAAAVAEQNPTSKFWADHAVCLRSAAERLG